MSGLLWSHAPLNTRKARLVSEERANQITHGIATALSVVGSAFLIHEAIALGNPVVTAACVIYATTLTLVYLTSTLSHSFLSGKWKHSFRTLDQVSIFLLISGAFTPVGLTVCNKGYWLLIPLTMWTLSLTGVFLKLFVTGSNGTRLVLHPDWLPAVAGHSCHDRLVSSRRDRLDRRWSRLSADRHRLPVQRSSSALLPLHLASAGHRRLRLSFFRDVQLPAAGSEVESQPDSASRTACTSDGSSARVVQLPPNFGITTRLCHRKGTSSHLTVSTRFLFSGDHHGLVFCVDSD